MGSKANTPMKKPTSRNDLSDTVGCIICEKLHIRRPGKANLDNPLCDKCAAVYSSIPENTGPMDKVNTKLKKWK